MNNVYTHNFKEAEVMDDNGNIRKIDYSDNIEEILETENVIENIEKDIIDRKNYLKENHKYGTSNKLKLYMPTIISLLGLFASIMSINLSMYSTSKVLIAIEFVGGTIGALTTMSYSVASFVNRYSSSKHYKRVEAKLYGLEKILEREKTKLKELNNNKTVNKNKKDDDNQLKMVKDTNINSINSFVSLLSVFGYYQRKYTKMYKSGELDREVLFCYSEEDVEIVHDYFEEKAKVLSKKKDRKLKN